LYNKNGGERERRKSRERREGERTLERKKAYPLNHYVLLLKEVMGLQNQKMNFRVIV
jgi:hypothetical protein